jgi:hypothetical protein
MNVYGEPAQSRLAHSTESVLRRFLATVNPRDYIALLAYMRRTDAIHDVLTSFRVQLREHMHIATTLGYGPRYLHSTGQLHKDGPNSGLFLLLTADSAEDLPIPGEVFGFATLLRAQALGDHRALLGKGRRVLHVHLRGDLESSLRHLGTVMESALTEEATQLR